jgi:hypothetical protein
MKKPITDEGRDSSRESAASVAQFFGPVVVYMTIVQQSTDELGTIVVHPPAAPTDQQRERDIRQLAELVASLPAPQLALAERGDNPQRGRSSRLASLRQQFAALRRVPTALTPLANLTRSVAEIVRALIS